MSSDLMRSLRAVSRSSSSSATRPQRDTTCSLRCRSSLLCLSSASCSSTSFPPSSSAHIEASDKRCCKHTPCFFFNMKTVSMLDRNAFVEFWLSAGFLKWSSDAKFILFLVYNILWLKFLPITPFLPCQISCFKQDVFYMDVALNANELCWLRPSLPWSDEQHCLLQMWNWWTSTLLGKTISKDSLKTYSSVDEAGSRMIRVNIDAFM